MRIFRASRLPQVSDPTPDVDPRIPLTRHDEVVIHFRCGDIMSHPHPKHYFVSFSSWAKHIPENTSNIGVVTQPFDSVESESQRAKDAMGGPRCKLVVTEFEDYLKKRFPNSLISIYSTDSIVLAWSRMVMARTLLVGAGTFASFPSIANFGSAYVLEHPRIQGSLWRAEDLPFLQEQKGYSLSRVKENNALPSARIIAKWGNGLEGNATVLGWFETTQ